MLSYVLRRLVVVGIGLLIVSFGIFYGIRRSPIDPANTMIPGGANAEEKARIHAALGLDRPILVQYGRFLHGAFTRFDFGTSYYSHEPVTRLVLQRVPVSLSLVLPAFLLVLCVGIPTGFLAAIRRNSLLDYSVVGAVYVIQSFADFWIAIVLILVFVVRIPIFPAFGRAGPTSFVLPALSLAIPLFGRVTRFVRAGLLDVLQHDYIRTARSKGASASRVYVKHAFRNVLVPLVTDTSMQFVWTIGNAIVIEEIFAWPGIGRLTINAIRLGDFPTAQLCVLFFAVMFMVVNLAVDISYTFLDPRIHYA
jgi:peptide/nickel transport system permease protein